MNKSSPISISHPDLIKEWDFRKNETITPDKVTFGSDKKVWWICSKDKSHSWLASISHRVHGRNCPYCVGKKINDSNSLATTHPKLLLEWHPSKNGKINPKELAHGSKLKVWWKCTKGSDHEWQASITNRVKGRGCPFCNGNKVSLTNCLSKTHSEISKEWHPLKNGLTTTNDITKGIVKNYWWQCPKEKSHEYLASPNNRTQGKGCPYCSGKKVNISNSFSALKPLLLKEWHSTKNGEINPENLTIGSGKKIWWQCLKNMEHVWLASIDSRNSGNNCPYCSNQKVTSSNSLAITNPKLSSEWHQTKNGSLTPFDVVEGSGKSVWWKCNKGNDHEWRASISSRNSGNGCPICYGIKVVKSNSLKTMFPKVSSEWHPSENGLLLPENVYYSTLKKVWWKCAKGIDHEWITSVRHRTINKSGCPFCTLTPQSRQELTITFELKSIFKNINPKGFKTRINNKIWSIDIFISELNLGIEFDGSHWHKDKADLDKLKSKQLRSEGFKLIRIREEPLKRISENDIMSSKKFDAKKITNDLLKMIMQDFELDSQVFKKILNYLKKEKLQNEGSLNEYIEMILNSKKRNK
jgi:very-short-patch-repair endonuclease